MPQQTMGKGLVILACAGLLLAACTGTRPMTDAGFNQSGSMSYPNRVPQGNVKTTTVP